MVDYGNRYKIVSLGLGFGFAINDGRMLSVGQSPDVLGFDA